MQEATIIDRDGITREYAYDTFDGALYIKDAATKAQNPGRPYRPIYWSRRPDLYSLRASHAELWADPKAAADAISRVRPVSSWRAA